MKFSYIQQTFFFALLTATSFLFLWMLGTYLLPIFWALVIAIVFYPVYTKFEKWTSGHRSLASILTICSVVLVVVLPLTLIGGLLVQESLSLYQKLSTNSAGLSDLDLLVRTEQFATYLEPYGVSKDLVSEKLREWTAAGAQVFASALFGFSKVTLSFMLSAAIMLYLLFFFFRDGIKLREILIHHLPLGDTREKRLFSRFAETSRAVVKGTLSIALIQGFIGGSLFLLVGIANPVLWGAAMAFFAIIPAIGPAIIWLPASILLITTGSIWEGVTILIVGVFVISLIDNLLRPILVGRDSKMPDAIVLLSTIGGLTAFGISGFVTGPIIAAFFLSLWIMFEERYHKELSRN